MESKAPTTTCGTRVTQSVLIPYGAFLSLLGPIRGPGAHGHLLWMPGPRFATFSRKPPIPSCKISTRVIQSVFRPIVGVLYLRLDLFAAQELKPTYSECVVHASLILVGRGSPAPRLQTAHPPRSIQCPSVAVALRTGSTYIETFFIVYVIRVSFL